MRRSERDKRRQQGNGALSRKFPLGEAGAQSLWGSLGDSREQAPTSRYSGPLPRALFLQNVLPAATGWSLDSGLMWTLTVVQ